MFDYEFARMLPFVRPEMGIAPETVTDPVLARHFKRGLHGYSGLKEDVYVASYHPDPSFRKGLGLADQDIVVTIRPPANEAHYHNPESEKLFQAVVDRLGTTAGVKMIILPRNEKTQRELVRTTWPAWCADGRIILPDRALNGLDLIWNSDLVVSGGGTMNREAAALGVPVYSIFRGKLGAVDRYLSEQGRLTLLGSVEDVRTKIKIERREKQQDASFAGRTALRQIVDAIEEVASGPATVAQQTEPLQGQSRP
jgi:predicted glycosyltransferase